MRVRQRRRCSFKQALHLVVATAEYYDVAGIGEAGHTDVSYNLNPWVILQSLAKNPVDYVIEEGRGESISWSNADLVDRVRRRSRASYDWFFQKRVTGFHRIEEPVMQDSFQHFDHTRLTSMLGEMYEFFQPKLPIYTAT